MNNKNKFVGIGFKKEELIGKLGAMFAYAIAHMQTMEISERKQNEFKIAHRQLRNLISEVQEGNE